MQVPLHCLCDAWKDRQVAVLGWSGGPRSLQGIQAACLSMPSQLDALLRCRCDAWKAICAVRGRVASSLNQAVLDAEHVGHHQARHHLQASRQPAHSFQMPACKVPCCGEELHVCSLEGRHQKAICAAVGRSSFDETGRRNGDTRQRSPPSGRIRPP